MHVSYVSEYYIQVVCHKSALHIIGCIAYCFARCTYIILANLGQVIHLRFEEFETEDHFDKITIFAGNTRWDNAILREHSGISKPSKSPNIVP